MRVLLSVAWREFAGYFSTALAAVFLAVFLGAAGALTFFVGGFLANGQADLSAFFRFHPWLFLVLMPALGMRLWAEERSAGTIEFLLTLPIAPWQAVLGKFLAAWAVAGLALALTFPTWITVNFLGDPDNGVILVSYLGSFLMGGAFLAMACCFSALTSNQVIAFVMGVTAGFLLLMTSLRPLLSVLGDGAPGFLVALFSSFSFIQHFDAITRGILDLRDVIFFVSFIALMLFLNVQILDRERSGMAMSSARGIRPGPATLSGISAILAVLLFFSVNYLAATTLAGARLDLTQNRLFTLSDSARAVLADIGDPVTVKLYRTEQFIASVPVLEVQEKQLAELLATFEQASSGKVRIETIDVAPFSPEEDEALGYGLEGFALNDQGERGYFGIVGTNGVDDLETIAFADPSRGAQLQYDLTRLVYRLAHPDEPNVRIVDGLSMFGSMMEGRRPWALLDMIGANFDLDAIAKGATAIPDDTDVLVLVHPVGLSPALQYGVDQYVLGGGAALVFLDPLAEHSPPNPQNPSVPMEPSSDLAGLMDGWGIEMRPDQVVGDSDMALQTVGTAGMQRVVADYLPWLRIDGAAFNKDEIITEQLAIMRMSSAGAIGALDGAGTTMTPLIQTSPNSMLMDRTMVMQRGDPNTLLAAFQPSGQRQVLAARISGIGRTAFPDGPPPEASADTTQVKEGAINVVLVADTDLLADSHVVGENGRPNSNNSDFVLNAIETLAGGDALIGARGGGLAYRPFTTIQAIEARAEETYRATEQRLTTELADAQAQLQQLQQQSPERGSDPLAAMREQQDAVAQSNARIVDLRQQLRQVRTALRTEIEGLETQLQFFNIVLGPVIIIVLSILLALWRRARQARQAVRA